MQQGVPRDRRGRARVRRRPDQEAARRACGTIRRGSRSTPRSGKPAETTWEVLERFDGFTFVRCLPKTGRTHQIRVHLQSIGHPVLCDATYGRREQLLRKRPRSRAPRRPRPSRCILGRQALHAFALEFHHPLARETHSGSRRRFRPTSSGRSRLCAPIEEGRTDELRRSTDFPGPPEGRHVAVEVAPLGRAVPGVPGHALGQARDRPQRLAAPLRPRCSRTGSTSTPSSRSGGCGTASSRTRTATARDAVFGLEDAAHAPRRHDQGRRARLRAGAPHHPAPRPGRLGEEHDRAPDEARRSSATRAAPEGALYTFSWVLEDGTLAPLADERGSAEAHPGRRPRARSSRQLNERLDRTYRISVPGDLDPMSRWYFNHFLKRYEGDWTRVLEHVTRAPAPALREGPRRHRHVPAEGREEPGLDRAHGRHQLPQDRRVRHATPIRARSTSTASSTSPTAA